MAFFFLLLILFPNLSSASDFISLNQSISGDQQLISKNDTFTLGFFKPGNSPYYYIGIWYSLNTVSELTPVWVANRETPLSDSSKTELKISKNGNLVIANSSNSSVWSTNVRNIASTPATVATLLDSGNLVLMNGNLTIWQSFDHPTHTYLPGGKLGLNKVTNELQRLTSWKSEDDPAPGIFSLAIDPNGSSQYFICWNNSVKYWSSGYWNGYSFSSVPEMTKNYVFNYSFVSSDREMYFTYSLYPDTPILSRLIIDTSGQIKQLTWVENAKQWVLFWSQPRKQCAVQALCGPFGSCNENALPYCICIKGFAEKSPSDWALGDRTQGCSRNNQLQCGFNNSGNVENDKFFPMSNMKFPDNPKKLYIKDASDCEQYCLNSCSCTAYCITSNSTCLFWIGDLVNLQDRYDSGMSDGGTIFLRLAASEISDPKSNNRNFHILHKTKSMIGLSTAAGILLLACVGCFLWRRKKINMKKRMRNATPGFNEHSSNADREDIVDLPLFEVSTIVNATNYFSAANKLGVGGFGSVYKGILGPDQEIAMKRLSKTSMQGVEEFKNEVMLIAKLQHRNLVRLLGCCIHREERMLIYEYMANKSLDAFLFGKKGALLDWNIRYQIILGVSRGLLYLHHDSRLRIIHRDLKASNILLDKNLKPKISDFGLARILIGDETTDLNTRKVVGTYGYMSPEYAMEGIFSMKSDVFSFWVLMLEIISGRKNRGEYIHSTHLNLVAHAWSLWNEGKSLQVVDETLSNSYSEEEVLKCIKVGLLCVQEHARDRPLISSVIELLASASDIASIPMPKHPGFMTRTGPTETNSNSEIHEECTTNNITESFEGR